MMKMIIMMYMISMSMPINLLMMLIIYKFLNMKTNPIKKLIILMTFILLMMINIYMNTLISLNPMLVIITFISGLMIMFIYFTSTINMHTNKNFFMLYLLIPSTFIIIYMILFKKNKFLFMKTYLYKNNIFHIYYNTKLIIMLLMIFMLIMMLYLSFKMCYLKKKLYDLNFNEK